MKLFYYPSPNFKTMWAIEFYFICMFIVRYFITRKATPRWLVKRKLNQLLAANIKKNVE